jgi:hypothetical protein
VRERKPKPLSVRVSFGGLAAQEIRRMLRSGLDGPTMPLVVEGLALSELRRRIRARGPCKRCGNDGNPCSACGAAGQKIELDLDDP